MNTLFLVINENCPPAFVNPINIIGETDKAFKMQNYYTKKIAWVPKKALKKIDDNWFTFENWFRKFDEGKAIKEAIKLCY